MRATANRKVQVPSGRGLSKIEQFDLRGLNTATPDEIMAENESPYLLNARMFAKDDEERRTAISTRKGPGFYSVPIGETQDHSITSTTGAADQTLTSANWIAQKLTATADGRLTKIDVNFNNPGGTTGLIMIKVYANDSGEPGDLLSSSSITDTISDGGYAYYTARFIEAPEFSTSDIFWVVAHVQEERVGGYSWSSTTSATTALTSSNSGGSWTAAAFAMNVKSYLSTDGQVKGVARYYPSSNTNKTILWHGTVGYSINDVTGATTSIMTGLNANATNYYTADADDKQFFVNAEDVPKWHQAGSATNVGGSPGVSRYCIVHKNRLFLVPIADPTKIIFSDIGDFDTYDATSFLYVPSPKSPSPITGWISFQDNLVIFTRNEKWILYGSDLSTFVLRQAVGKKGAVSQNVIDADENYIYFLSDDGVYRFNGSQDEKISAKIAPTIETIADKTTCHGRVWDGGYRLYFTPTGEANNERMLLWDIIYEQWFLDTKVRTKRSVVLYKDENKLVEASDQIGALYYAEQDYNILGSQIDFEYRTKYFSMSNAAAKKRTKRFYPLLRAQSVPVRVRLDIDKDFSNNPATKFIETQGEGAIWGQFDWGDGTVWGKTELIDPRITIPGTAVYYQFRFIKTGVDTPVELLGYVLYYRMKRPK